MTDGFTPRLPFVLLNGTLDAAQAGIHATSSLMQSWVRPGAGLGEPNSAAPAETSPSFAPAPPSADATATAGSALARAIDSQAREALGAFANHHAVTEGLEAPADRPAPKTPPRELGPKPFKP